VLFGEVVFGTWTAGLIVGITVAYINWGAFLITGLHVKVGLCILALLLFGLVSGLYMNLKNKKRRFLPLIHGLNNLLVLGLALYQISTGWWVYRAFVLGEG
jgi:hypothetical protein